MDEEEMEVPQSKEGKVPWWLLLTYIGLIGWGVWAFFTYWNGSHGFLDRGHWQALQEAADTTYPFEKKNP